MDVGHKIVETSFQSLPAPGKFLTLAELLEALKCCNVLKNVPIGEKSNVFLVSNNTANVAKRQNNVRSNYMDDCGVWDGRKDSTVNSYILLEGNGNVKTVYLKNNLY